ncbi:hypothetical protein NDU88_000516 [Pleurodeles waltl]|uniref:Uncharacterized protein n=1 Tax=Pleurodeles waltl TaxID=8319 RepID=A0AAV7S6C4_PLEWA|nr:hypothetical protein NDU88_000516 [Pleurodeles waltl]
MTSVVEQPSQRAQPENTVAGEKKEPCLDRTMEEDEEEEALQEAAPPEKFKRNLEAVAEPVPATGGKNRGKEKEFRSEDQQDGEEMRTGWNRIKDQKLSTKCKVETEEKQKRLNKSRKKVKAAPEPNPHQVRTSLVPK